MCLEVPDNKIKANREFALRLLNSKVVSGLQLASFEGKVASLWPALGHTCRLMTKFTNIQITCSSSWDNDIVLTQSVLQEIRFWYNNFGKLPYTRLLKEEKVETVVDSDASQHGYGGYVVTQGPNVTHGNWSLKESLESSTSRELKAVWLVMLSLKSFLTGKNVKLVHR